jgi:hypothetical protein
MRQDPEPLLSIAVPTHNRARYAVHAVASLLAIPDRCIEVVVSDTSTDGELAARIAADESFRDPRLNYFRPPQPLDMTGNHNAAIAATRGKYVCLIGDDDTVTADAVLAASWAAENDVDLIAPNVVANYAWPDFRSRYFGSRHASRLYFAKQIGGARIRECGQALLDALLNAAQGTDGLPKIYHGIVRRALLERIRARSGAYFHGSSPDVSGAIALAICSERFVTADYPLTIPGASGGSNTGRSAMNKHKGRLDQESQTKGFEVSGWSAGVPRLFSVETVWAHAALETILRLAPERQSGFNFARLIAVCRVLHGEYRAEIDRAGVEAQQIVGVSAETLSGQVAVEIARFKRARLAHILKRLLHPTVAGTRTYAAGLETIADTPAALAKHMRTRGLQWHQIAALLTAHIPKNNG